MDKTWNNWNFETCPGGVSSAVSADLLPINQFAWGKNVSVRGAKMQTRPPIGCRMVIPSGLVQGASYFSVQGGMIVVMIAGKPYRLRIGESLGDFAYDQIQLPWWNSALVKQSWFQQTIETLVIQDGQSQPILYNGSTAYRAGVAEVPLGNMMAYGNGRLWVAVGKRLLAGDIRTSTPGSELKFTEVQYLNGGGALYFEAGITGLAFIPVTGTTDYGTLILFGSNYAQSIRADITSRDDWGNYPGFVTNVLRTIGASSDWSLTQVNQDLFWRDSAGGIRSLRASLQDESGSGSSPISREVDRLVNYDSQGLMGFCSGAYFDNRLLMTSSPFLNTQGGVSWKNIIPLDFAPLSTLAGKTTPAYDGQWEGVNWTQLISGNFNGRNRCFGISSDEDGLNRLWEFGVRGIADRTITCGLEDQVETLSPIVAQVEYPRIDFGANKIRKRLERCDVWLSDVQGEVALSAYWRSDNTQKWTLWDEVEACATMEDNSTATPHVWKNLLPQQRPQIKSFTIPDAIDAITKYAANVGFQFQLRLVWTGKAKIERCMLWAKGLSDPDYAERGEDFGLCMENDVTGNIISYEIPLSAGCAEISVSDDVDTDIAYDAEFSFGSTEFGDAVDQTFRIHNPGQGPLTVGEISFYTNNGFIIVSQPAESTIQPGEYTTFVLRMTGSVHGENSAVLLIPNSSIATPVFRFDPVGVVGGAIVDLSYSSRAGNVSYAGFYDPRFVYIKNNIGTVAEDFDLVDWTSLFAFPSTARVYYSGKFYRSLVGSNLNHTPNVSPTFWQECPPPLFWLRCDLAGVLQECLYSGSAICSTASPANYTRLLPDSDFGGHATVDHAGTYVSAYTERDFENDPVFLPGAACVRNNAGSDYTDQSQILARITTRLSLPVTGVSTSSQSNFVTTPCTAGGGGSNLDTSTVVRSFSIREDGYDYMTPNGAQQSSQAGTWATSFSQVGGQISIGQFAITNLVPLAQYTLEISYSASAGAAPANTIESFTADGAGTAAIASRIPYGNIGAQVTISGYAVTAV